MLGRAEVEGLATPDDDDEEAELDDVELYEAVEGPGRSSRGTSSMFGPMLAVPLKNASIASSRLAFDCSSRLASLTPRAERENESEMSTKHRFR